MAIPTTSAQQQEHSKDGSMFKTSDEEEEYNLVNEGKDSVKTHSPHHHHHHHHCHDHDHSHDHSHDHNHNHNHHSHSHKCSHDGWKQYLPHAHSFHERLRSDRRSLAISCIILGVIFLLQLVGGYIAHSSVLRVEAVHSALDGGTILLSLLAVAVAGRKASNKMPYGYARAEVLAALISLLALTLMCVKLSTEAADRLWHYFHGSKAKIHVEGRIIFVAEAIALFCNLLIAFVLAKNDASLNIRALRAHVIADSLENILVLVAGVVMWKVPGWGILDAFLTPMIVGLICYLNKGMVKETISILMQAAPEWIDVDDITQQIMTINNVISVPKLQIWTLTAEQIVAACVVIVESDIQFSQIELIRKQVHRLLARQRVTDITVQICSSNNGFEESETSDDDVLERMQDSTRLEYKPENGDDVV